MLTEAIVCSVVLLVNALWFQVHSPFARFITLPFTQFHSPIHPVHSLILQIRSPFARFTPSFAQFDISLTQFTIRSSLAQFHSLICPVHSLPQTHTSFIHPVHRRIVLRLFLLVLLNSKFRLFILYLFNIVLILLNVI